jgi:hypothetical protein
MIALLFALMRRRVRHGALTMRLRSHVRSAVKTASWRAFAAVDTFGLVWLFSGDDTTHAIAAAGAVVSVEANTDEVSVHTGACLKAMFELMMEKQVLSFNPASRLEICRRRTSRASAGSQASARMM